MITTSYAYLDLTAEELADLRMLQSYSAKPVKFLGLRIELTQPRMQQLGIMLTSVSPKDPRVTPGQIALGCDILNFLAGIMTVPPASRVHALDALIAAIAESTLQ